ncbi:hypothetical protein NXX37_01945 [Parabacteroides distasonis]|nr:hypothetical protein NXX37_01945 [Parabacteroides distasonis]
MSSPLSEASNLAVYLSALSTRPSIMFTFIINFPLFIPYVKPYTPSSEEAAPASISSNNVVSNHLKLSSLGISTVTTRSLPSILFEIDVYLLRYRYWYTSLSLANHTSSVPAAP